jgi:probable Rubsico expression protein CbbX
MRTARLPFTRLSFTRLPYTGLGALLIVVTAGLIVGWARLNHALFTVLTSGVLLSLLLGALVWDALRQVSPENLEARGFSADDSTLRVFDEGLRRDFTPGLRLARPRAARPPTPRIPGAAAPRPRVSAVSATPPARLPRGGPPRRRGAALSQDATVTLAQERQAAGIDDLFAALDRELVGLVPVKKKVAEIGSLLLVDRARQRFGLSASRPNLHMCFTGPPGTGKTTVALLMADLLHRLGYLETDRLVHAMRDDLVGQYIGQTAPRTKQILGRAMGGVLFIDEAYTLYRAEDSKDYGQECVDILMQVMENDRSRLVVILAGYKDRMDHFFESNPGMSSRVAHHLDFAPYEVDELLAIGGQMLDQSSYYLSGEAGTALRGYLAAARTDSQFANARSIRNALESARLRHAYRLAAEPDRPWSRDDLMRLEPADVVPEPDRD